MIIFEREHKPYTVVGRVAKSGESECILAETAYCRIKNRQLCAKSGKTEVLFVPREDHTIIENK